MSRRVKLNHKLETVAAEMVRDDVYDLAKMVAKDAKRRVPRDTGRLARTVHAEKRNGEAVVVMGDRKAFYAAWVEWGSAHTPARAPLRRAAEAVGIYKNTRR